MSIRTFIALELDAAVVERLVAVQRSLSSAGANVRWVAGENLHLTLKFLGEVSEEHLPDVCEVVSQAASQIKPFDFSVSGVVCVPRAGAVRMVWAGVDEQTGRLGRLQGMLEESLEDMGFCKENRSYKPHLTLGRLGGTRNVRELRNAVSDIAQTEFGTARAEEIMVFSSQLTPEGPVYAPLSRAKLGGD